MLINLTNLVVLGLVGLVLLRATLHELARRRRLEWQKRILELLAVSVQRGRAMVPVLERMAAGEPGRLATICRAIAAGLAEGLPLSRALAAAAPGCFPPPVVATIAGTEGTAALGDALHDLVARTDEHEAAGHRLRMALTYPVLLAVYFAASHQATSMALRLQPPALLGRHNDTFGWLLLMAVVVFVIWLQGRLMQDRSLGRWLRRKAARLAHSTRSGRLLPACDFLSALAHVVATGTALPTAIRRTARATGDERLAGELLQAADAIEAGSDAESALRRTFLPEFAIVTAAASAHSSPMSQASALRHGAEQCRRRWLAGRERTLAVLPIACVATIGALMALDFAALQQLHDRVVEEVTLW